MIPGSQPAPPQGVKAVRKYRARMTPFWMVYEMLVCGLMAAGLTVLFVYSLRLSGSAPRQLRWVWGAGRCKS